MSVNKCSREAQRVIRGGIWYYESPGSIEMVINKSWFLQSASTQGIIVKISRRKLAASLKRMNASRRKRK